MFHSLRLRIAQKPDIIRSLGTNNHKIRVLGAVGVRLTCFSLKGSLGVGANLAPKALRTHLKAFLGKGLLK